MKSWRILPILVAGTILTGGWAHADDEGVQLDDLKAQLSANSKPGTQAALDQFAVDGDEENKQREAKEAELLKRLKIGNEKQQAHADTGGQLSNDEEAAAKAVIGFRSKPAAQSQQDADVERPAAQAEEREAVSSKQLAALNSKTNELSHRLTDSQSKLAQSQKELKEARDRLMIAEAEVEKLQQLLEKRGMNALDGSRPVVSEPAAAAASLRRASAPAPVPVVQKGPEDLPVATVNVDKANLRTGPGTEHSALMSVSKGTRLAIETRDGSWYRVFTPTGTRAWITGDVLTFNTADEGLGAPSALKVRAVSSDLGILERTGHGPQE